MIGIDEVGRGSLAGPLLVVAARAKSILPIGLKDSKLMTKRQRQSIFEHLTSSLEFGEGWVGAREIDRHGLAKALRLGVARSLRNLEAKFDEEIILDGKTNYLPKKFINARTMVDADNLVPVVSAASIYAKVMRDKLMHQLAKNHPSYSFDKHVGYGTALHQRALQQFGPLKSIHRFSFKPLRAI